MKSYINKSAIAIVATMISLSPASAEDDRELIKLSVEQQNLLLAEMRGLLETFDDTLAALAQGDIKKVKYIADYELGFGHNRFKKMLASGMPESEVAKQRLKMLKRRKGGGGGGHGAGKGGGIFGQGVGRFMPPAVRELGQSMHKSAGNLSLTISKVKGEPTVKDYQAILSDLQTMTSTCRACHVSFKVR